MILRKNNGSAVKNFNRLTAFLLILVFVMLTLAGCGGYGEYTTQIYSRVNDGVDAFTVDIECTEVWDVDTFKLFRFDKTLEFLGQSYEVEYKESIKGHGGRSYTTDYYTNDDHVKIGVRRDTKEIISFEGTKKMLEASATHSDVIRSKDEAISKATEVALAYIDASRYEVECETWRSDVEVDGAKHPVEYYNVSFKLRVCGLDSTDYVNVVVLSKGDIYRLNVGDVGVFDENIVIDQERLLSSVKERLTESAASNNYTLKESSITHSKVVKAPSGDFAVISDVDAVFEENHNIFERNDTSVSVITWIG